MIQAIRNLVGASERPTEGQSLPPRSAATIRAELSIAQDSATTLATKLEGARNELTAAQERFDSEMQSFALGHSSREADRGELQAGVSKLDAFRRIHLDLQQSIVNLTSELADAELTEAIAAGKKSLGPLVTMAEAALSRFEQAAEMARTAENALFVALFDERSGLRQSFAIPELIQEARKQRYRLNNRAQTAANTFRYPLNPRFETDGEVNLGVDVSANFPERLAEAIQVSALRSRIQRMLKSAKEY